MPRVIFVNRYYFPDQSATSQMLSDLARRMSAEGLAVHVVCSRQLYEDAAANLRRAEVIEGVAVHRVWTTTFGRSSLLGRAVDYATFYLSAALLLLRLVNSNAILVAKTDPPLISLVAAAVCRLHGAALVNWLQDVFPEVASGLGASPLPRWLDGGLRRLRNRSLRRAQMNVVLGERMRAHVLAQGVEQERVCIIENWADGTLISPIAVSARLREEFSIDGEFVVGYSGNLGRAHEYATLLQAAELLRDQRDVLFLMIGAGAKMRQLQLEVETRGLANVRFLPYQPREALAQSLAVPDLHLVSLLPAMEGLIVPSKFYGILAAGRPIVFIGDPDGELGKVIRAGECGSVIPLGQGELLAQTVLRWRDDAAARLEAGRRARRLFEAKYTLDAAALKWRSVLTKPQVDGSFALR